MRDALLPIGALSRRTGCNIETIRYYERIGLVPMPPRTDGRQRRYDGAAVKRLSFIRRSRALGFSLEQIRELIDLSEQTPVNCGAVREIAERNLEVVQAKIADLHRMEAILAETVTQCRAGSAPRCPVIDTLSER